VTRATGGNGYYGQTPSHGGANTGTGGGGDRNGGSGIVILRYGKSEADPDIGVGLTYEAPYVSGDYKVLKFTGGSGSIVWS
jgi:hypothetical protein